jgi:fructose-like PTS system EIIB component
MFFVCVAACPTGIAHTYMAAESLAKLGEELGHEIKVETQGSLGVENEITADDLARADGAIIATEIAIEGADRFESLPTIECAVADPIKQGPDVIEALIAQIQAA